jgi:SAM-dependent methyltransferase
MPALEVFLDLGFSPLADRMLTQEQLTQPEPHFPLEVAFCHECGLVQILETVPPEVLFCQDYPYYSSFSPALLEHSRQNVEELVQRQGLGARSLVVELASNDGYLLKNYLKHGVKVLGIDPAEGPARKAQERGVPTMVDFFTRSLARQLADEGKKADVIHANNVLAHVMDTNGFVSGIAELLKDDGVAVIEVPYVKDLVDKCEFDTIYHEHLCYFSVTALDHLFRRNGLFLNDIRQLSIHGGSLRLFVGKRGTPTPAVLHLLQQEQELNLHTISFYASFANHVRQIKQDLLRLLASLKQQRKKIAAYGAAAKGTTMINYVGVGRELIDYVVDRNTFKHGRYMPGLHVPIYDTSRLLEDMPDYVLVLAWNFLDEIQEQQRQYLRHGGRFIVPVPTPRIV